MMERSTRSVGGLDLLISPDRKQDGQIQGVNSITHVVYVFLKLGLQSFAQFLFANYDFA